MNVEVGDSLHYSMFSVRHSVFFLLTNDIGIEGNVIKLRVMWPNNKPFGLNLITLGFKD